MTDTGNAVIKPSSGFSLVWLVPFVALLICLWLGWNAYQNDDMSVKVQFSNAQGIVIGKTKVLFNGMQIGYVEKIHVTDDLKKVIVTLSVDNKLKSWLTDKTEFWIVRPDVSLSGVTGLETLVSGNYIAVKPDNKGKPVSYFTALKHPPKKDKLSGLHISLTATNLHSVSVGSPVYFHQIQVGEVTDYTLQVDNHLINIELVIRPQYSELVHKSSRFWNVSGIDISASLTGLKVRTESLTSLVKGGISFCTPKWDTESAPVADGAGFKLYKNFESAQNGITVCIRFPLLYAAIQKNTRVAFHGITIGHVRDIKINSDLTHFTAVVSINPEASQLLVEGAYFWVVRPQLSLNSTSDVKSLIGGAYIAVDAPRRSIEAHHTKIVFDGYEKRPRAPFDMPGLNITLKVDTDDKVRTGSPVFYRQQVIGRTEYTWLDKSGQFLFAAINIFKEYEHLINESSQFTGIDGVSVQAGFTGVKIDTPSISALLSGGLMAMTPDLTAPPVSQNKTFVLLSDKGAVKNKLQLTLTARQLGSVKAGVPVLYLGVPVGKVTGYHLDNPANQVRIDIAIDEAYGSLVTPASRFWNVSGIKVDAGLFDGVSIQTSSLQTVITGGIAFATPEKSVQHVKADTRFILHEEPRSEWKTWHPKIPLKEKAEKPVAGSGK